MAITRRKPTPITVIVNICRTRAKIREPSVCVYSIRTAKPYGNLSSELQQTSLFIDHPMKIAIFSLKSVVLFEGDAFTETMLSTRLQNHSVQLASDRCQRCALPSPNRVNRLAFYSCVFCAVVFQWGDVTPPNADSENSPNFGF